MSHAAELEADLRSEDPRVVEAVIETLRSFRYDASAPPLPRFGIELLPKGTSDAATGTLFEVMSWYPFAPAMDAAARGRHLGENLLALRTRQPIFRLVLVLADVAERPAVLRALLETLGRAATEDELLNAERFLEFMRESEIDHEAMRESARAWPHDSPLHGSLPSAST